MDYLVFPWGKYHCWGTLKSGLGPGSLVLVHRLLIWDWDGVALELVGELGGRERGRGKDRERNGRRGGGEKLLSCTVCLKEDK